MLAGRARHTARCVTIGSMSYDRELANRVRELLALEDGHDERPMFGGLAFLLNGHMAVAVSHNGGLLVRCDPASTGTLLGRAHTRPFQMGERRPRGWMRVAPEGLRNGRELRRWVAVGVAYVRTLAPKTVGVTRPGGRSQASGEPDRRSSR